MQLVTSRVDSSLEYPVPSLTSVTTAISKVQYASLSNVKSTPWKRSESMGLLYTN
jgi:hypothetical protein